MLAVWIGLGIGGDTVVLVRGALLAVEIAARGEWEDTGLLARTRSTLLDPQTVVLDPERSSHPGGTGS